MCRLHRRHHRSDYRESPPSAQPIDAEARKEAAPLREGLVPYPGVPEDAPPSPDTAESAGEAGGGHEHRLRHRHHRHEHKSKSHSHPHRHHHHLSAKGIAKRGYVSLDGPDALELEADAPESNVEGGSGEDKDGTAEAGGSRHHRHHHSHGRHGHGQRRRHGYMRHHPEYQGLSMEDDGGFGGGGAPAGAAGAAAGQGLPEPHKPGWGPPAPLPPGRALPEPQKPGWGAPLPLGQALPEAKKHGMSSPSAPPAVEVPWWSRMGPAAPSCHQAGPLAAPAFPAAVPGPSYAPPEAPQQAGPSAAPLPTGTMAAASGPTKAASCPSQLAGMAAGEDAGEVVATLERLRLEATQAKAQLAEHIDKKMCPVCMERPVDTAFNCGHAVCAGCADELMQQRGPQCPSCRTKVNLRLKLFV